MMAHTDEFRAGRLAWRFRASGADGRYVRQFAKFDEEVRVLLMRLAEVGAELPAVACYFDDQNWALITSKRLVWSDEGALSTLNLNEIQDAKVELESLLLAGTKLDLTQLTIVAKDGQHYRLRLEAGSPFSGFWNALKMATSWK